MFYHVPILLISFFHESAWVLNHKVFEAIEILIIDYTILNN